MLLVRVPALVVDGDVGDAALDQPPRHQAGLPEGVAAVAVPQLVLLLREIEDLARVAQDQVVGLLLALRRGRQLRHRPCMACSSVFSLWSSSRRSRCRSSEMPWATTPSTANRALRRVAAGGEGLVARAQEARLGEPPLRLGQHDVGRNQPLVAGVVALEQRDHRADARDRPSRPPGCRPVCTM